MIFTRKVGYQNSPPPSVGKGKIAVDRRMASIIAQQEAFSKKGKRDVSNRPISIEKCSLYADRIASIRTQQEAFSKKGQKSEESVPQIGRSNLNLKKMAAIKAQQESFAKKGQKVRDHRLEEALWQQREWLPLRLSKRHFQKEVRILQIILPNLVKDT